MTKSNQPNELLADLPVVIKKLSFEDYQKVDGFSAHSSRQLLLEPCKWANNTQTTTKEMDFGTACHYAVLECVKGGQFDEDLFFIEYALKPDCSKQTKAGKALHEEHEEYCKQNGKKSINREDFDLIKTMTKAILDSPASIFFGYQMDEHIEAFREISMFWKYKNDKGELIDCKARADALVVDYERKLIVIADLKTAQNASPKEFAKACANYGYGWQAGWYSLPFINDNWTVSFIAVAVEKSKKPTIGIYDLKQFGDIELPNIQDFLNECNEISKSAEEMNCYYKIETSLEVPAWFKGTKKAW